MLNADLLETIPQTKYLNAENYVVYRCIMRVFYEEYQKMRYQLDKDTILAQLRRDAHFASYPPEKLSDDLNQLVQWKNLSAIQDPHKVYTIKDFYNRQFQYMMTKEALEVERMTIVLERLDVQTAGLSSGLFRRIHTALEQAKNLDRLTHQEVVSWWQDLQEDFQRLNRNHQDYLSQFYGPAAEKQTRSVDFIEYKQHLIRYLEEFILELQNSTDQISAQLESFTAEQAAHIVELVSLCESEIPQFNAMNNPRRREELTSRNQGIWASLLSWFTGANATSRQIMDVTNEVIRSVVQNAAFLVRMRNMGVSNKAELRHLMALFRRCASLDEAHRLSALVFGAQHARHFVINAELETDRVDLSTYALQPMDREIQPRARSYKPRLDRSGFPDKSADKERQRKQVLEDERRLREMVMRYVQNGRLDFAAIHEPVPPEVRTVLLSWLAMANLSPDRRGRTQYGQAFTLCQNGERTCQMVCTDGVLTMPDCTLLFEEDSYV